MGQSNSDYQDREIVCLDCHEPFTWTGPEQEFYADRKFETPKRCRECRRDRKKMRQMGAQAGRDHDRDRGIPDFPRRGAR